MNVALANRQCTRKINLRRLKQLASALLADLKIEAAELGVHLVATPEMIRLNEQFLRQAGPTDVIAFDYSGPRRRTPGPRPQLHGEIFICVDEAVRQARAFHTSWQSEVARYLVHGVLHLLGHDDTRAGDRRKMKRAEDQRLRELSRRFSLAQLAHPAKLSACKNR